MYRMTTVCLPTLVDFDLHLEKYVNQYAKDYPGAELISLCLGSCPTNFLFTWKTK